MISQTPLLNQKIFPGTDHQDASPLADNSQNIYNPLVKNKDTESLTFTNPTNKNNKRNLCLVKSISLQSLETISFLGSFRDAKLNDVNDNNNNNDLNLGNHFSKK